MGKGLILKQRQEIYKMNLEHLVSARKDGSQSKEVLEVKTRQKNLHGRSLLEGLRSQLEDFPMARII